MCAVSLPVLREYQRIVGAVQVGCGVGQEGTPPGLGAAQARQYRGQGGLQAGARIAPHHHQPAHHQGTRGHADTHQGALKHHII